MAPGCSNNSEGVNKINYKYDEKCIKCKKVVKNGVLCESCDHWYHFRCGSFEEDGLNKTEEWSCATCLETNQGNVMDSHKDSGTENSLQKVIDLLLADMQELKKKNESLKKRVEQLSTSVNEQDFCYPKRVAKMATEQQKIAVQVTNRYNPIQMSDLDNFPPLTDATSEQKSRSGNKKLKPVKKQTSCNTKQKIKLYSASQGRDLAVKMLHKIDDVEVQGSVKPSACIEDVVRDVPNEGKYLKKNDLVVIYGGGNDVYKNQAADVSKSLKRLLPRLSHTNVVVCNISPRHDLTPNSCVNIEIQETNKKIRQVCSSYSFVEEIDVHSLPRDCFTRHGLHTNSRGKDKITNMILDVFKAISLKNKDNQKAIILPECVQSKKN